MNLPNIFKSKPQVVMLLNRNKVDFYTPVKKTKTTSHTGSLEIKSTEAEFGEVTNKEMLAKELADFFKSAQITGPQVRLVLGEQLVFKGKSKDVTHAVPLKESQKTLWQQTDGDKSCYVFNKDYPEVAELAASKLNGKIVGIYIRDALTQPDFAQEIFFSKQAKSAKIA
jgi:hypothetical protein